VKKTICLFTKNRRLILLCSDFLFLNRQSEEYDFYFFDDAFAWQQFLLKNSNSIVADEADFESCADVNDFVDRLEKTAAGISEKEVNPVLAQICGVSSKSEELRNKILLASRCRLPVLLTGESGSGKTMAAEMIHKLSENSQEPFFAVNVAAVSEGLIESELFGVAEGAFTDSRKRKGYFLSAGKGTLFLDEIGELKSELQAKLLTVTETGKIRPVGSDETKGISCRLIFATNCNIEKHIREGLFRQDLYYRISSLVIEIPPLRSRKEDIKVLCRQHLKGSGKTLSSGALSLLETFDWPGNVRQLFSCLDRAVLGCRDRIIETEDIILQ